MLKLLFCLTFAAILLAACTTGAPTAAPTSPAAQANQSSGEFACNPTGSEPSQFAEPAQVTRSGHDYVATITMESGGEIVVDLYPEDAPNSVNNFVFLACQGYYDGVTFHRVLEGFMAQGGDPTGTGTGGPGYTIQDEHDNGHLFDRPGLMAMARTSQPNSAGSQFFITFVPVPDLNRQYTIFGEVTEGMDVVNNITRRDPQRPNQPQGDVIAQIRVEER